MKEILDALLEHDKNYNYQFPLPENLAAEIHEMYSKPHKTKQSYQDYHDESDAHGLIVKEIVCIEDFYNYEDYFEFLPTGIYLDNIGLYHLYIHFCFKKDLMPVLPPKPVFKYFEKYAIELKKCISKRSHYSSYLYRTVQNNIPQTTNGYAWYRAANWDVWHVNHEKLLEKGIAFRDWKNNPIHSRVWAGNFCNDKPDTSLLDFGD